MIVINLVEQVVIIKMKKWIFLKGISFLIEYIYFTLKLKYKLKFINMNGKTLLRSK